MDCPKCGFHQDEGSECLRCGVIFTRCRDVSMPQSRTTEAERQGSPARRGSWSFRRLYRISRWVVLANLIVALVLILRPSAPPAITFDDTALHRAEVKAGEFEKSVQQGQAATLRIDESELNGWLNANLGLKRPANAAAALPYQGGESAVSLAKKALALQSGGRSPGEQVQSTVRDVRIDLLEDSLLVYVVFDLHGMDLSLQLEGRLMVRDGYLRVEPTHGKLGSLPLLPGVLEGAAHRLFDSPENKEKFHLPPHIADMRIEQGELIITSR